MSENLLERCRAIATSTWSDVLDSRGISGVLQGLVYRSGAERVAGRVVTVRETTATLGTYAVKDFAVGSMLEAVGQDEILLVDMGGAEISTFGGLAATAAVARGVAGVVIDGACRDLSDIRKTGLWLASRHVTPISGKQRVKLTDINVPVTCGGVEIRPGDYIIGDETGIVAIPADQLPTLLLIAEDLTSRDLRFEAALKLGQSFGSLAEILQHM